MFKETYHPKAFLSSRRNVRAGLVARSQIILRLETGASSVRDIAQTAKLSAATVRRHLRLLEAEKILFRTGRKEAIDLLGRFEPEDRHERVIEVRVGAARIM